MSSFAPPRAGIEDFCTALGVNILDARPRRIRGELAISPRHLTPAGTVHIGVVVGFAEELAARGAPVNGGAVTIEVKTNFFEPFRSTVLHGEACRLGSNESIIVWQTEISDEHGTKRAVISQTQLLSTSAGAVADISPLPTSPRLESERTSRRSGSGTPTVADQRREQIAAGACDVIATKGFDAATIREIAAAAGLHVPTMYQYVCSKDEILELVYNWVMEHLRTDVEQATRGCKTAREKLLATVDAMIQNGNKYRRQVGVLNRELKSLSPEARHRVLAEYQAILGAIAGLIREGIAKGEFRQVEPEIAANWVEAICDVWPLRQFSMKKFGLKSFQKEAAAFIDSSLTAR